MLPNIRLCDQISKGLIKILLFQKQLCVVSLSNKKHIATFKDAMVSFLQTKYQSITQLKHQVVLPFETKDIRWNGRHVGNLLQSLSLEETVQTLNQLPDKSRCPAQGTVDQVVTEKLSLCPLPDVLLLSNAMMSTFQSNFTTTLFYKQFLKMVPQLSEQCQNEQQFVFLVFLCGLGKTHPDSVRALILLYQKLKIELPNFQNLTLTEWTILCHSFFVSNINVSSRTVLRVLDGIMKQHVDAKGLTVDGLPILKVLRKGHFCTDALLDSVETCLSSESALQLNLTLVSHALALLADHRSLRSPPQLLNNVTQLIYNAKLDSPVSEYIHPFKGTRAKDLTRLFWAITSLVPDRSEVDQKWVEYFIEQVTVRWDRGEFRPENYHFVADFLLSLSCWQIYPSEFIVKVVSARFIKQIMSSKDSIRRSRFLLFLQAAELEAPELKLPFNYSANEVHRNIVKELEHRRFLASLFHLLRHQEGQFWNDVQCCYAIPYLNIAGITMEANGTRIAVEMLDSWTCIKHSKTPDRLVALKIRLLQKLGYTVIKVTPEDLQTPDQLPNKINNLQ